MISLTFRTSIKKKVFVFGWLDFLSQNREIEMFKFNWMVIGFLDGTSIKT
jgi:hypothetical protein